MTDAGKKEPNKILEGDPIVERLVPDPSEVPDLKVLTGWVGRSPRKGYWRLYLNLELNEYVEFRDEDIYHHQRFEGDQSPLGGTLVWVNRSAEILRTRTTPVSAQREFLQGDITQAFLAQTRSGGFTRGLVLQVLGLPPFTLRCPNVTAGTCTLVLCTMVEECRISREANPCA